MNLLITQKVIQLLNHIG